MKALVFDTETTGLISNRSIKLDKQPHVVEFYGAIVDLASGAIGHEFDTLIKPPIKMPAEATRSNGITDAMLVDASPFEKHAGHIRGLIELAPVVIAHNLSFDKEMLDIEFERIGARIRWPRGLCTVEQTHHIKKHRLNLSALHELLFGEKFEGAHRAKVDVQALTRCCVELHKRDLI